MPWAYLPHDLEFESAWVTLPNTYYDPKRGHDLYNRYLDELEYAGELGFDGICVNEHHQNAYGTMPAPNIMAAALARRTKSKIAILGNAISLRHNPLQVAEEVAMLDVVTGGRIISGFVRGIGAEYHSFGVNPAYSRERFNEAHDLIVKAWTEPGPFEWHSKHYKYKYVNTWPRPYQQPHPPVWIPSQGSAETVAWAAERRYTYLQTFSSVESVARILGQYREKAEEFGYSASPEQLGWALPVYIAESDGKAESEAAEHLEFFFNRLLRMPLYFFFPPGYLSEASTKGVLQSKSGLASASHTFDELIESGYAVAGSPETVVSRLKRASDEIGNGVLVPFLQFGTLPHDLTLKNMELFAREVMTELKDHVPAVYTSA
jgi:alkanesulfonate monooxygenase SsuD/methylene tetrahydromethanopterin reductase-like flavin-dependent oxidoreductase (luciferase family)